MAGQMGQSYRPKYAYIEISGFCLPIANLPRWHREADMVRSVKHPLAIGPLLRITASMGVFSGCFRCLQLRISKGSRRKFKTDG